MLFRASLHFYRRNMALVATEVKVSMLFRASLHFYPTVKETSFTEAGLCQCSFELHCISTNTTNLSLSSKKVCQCSFELHCISTEHDATRETIAKCVNALSSFTAFLLWGWCYSHLRRSCVSMLFRASLHFYTGIIFLSSVYGVCVNALSSFTAFLQYMTVAGMPYDYMCVNALSSFTAFLPHPVKNPWFTRLSEACFAGIFLNILTNSLFQGVFMSWQNFSCISTDFCPFSIFLETHIFSFFTIISISFQGVKQSFSPVYPALLWTIDSAEYSCLWQI